VNRQIVRLSLVSLAMIAALIAATTYWQTWAAAGLADRQDNSIQRVAQFKVKRGRIFAADGTLLAGNRVKTVSGNRLYFRRYPTHGLAAHVVGYSTVGRSRAGIERSMNSYLTASNGNLSTTLDAELNKLKGVTVTGNDVVLTIRPRAQRVAESLLRGECGAAVAVDTRTGAILALASSPGYDNSLVETDFARAQRAPGYPCKPPAALLDRATQGLYPPGSTFKIVTAAAALDTGAYRPDSSFDDPGYCEEYGKRISNAGNPDMGGAEVFGRLSLTTAFEHSVNSVFCNIGKQMGAKAILEQARRFGFYSAPPIETPSNERFSSGLYRNHKLWWPKDPASQVDPGRLAFGQERMLVTPLQMAMVSAAIANGGVLMRPHLVDRITDPDGKTIEKRRPERLQRAIKPETAAQLTNMMKLVTTSGTAARAFAGSPYPVAGKTGTAETGVDNVYVPSFTAFAPADKPRVAVAVVVENKYRGFGGSVAAPIARQLMQAIVGGR
jgi:peptidoglycan glycosyltransferase